MISKYILLMTNQKDFVVRIKKLSNEASFCQLYYKKDKEGYYIILNYYNVILDIHR